MKLSTRSRYGLKAVVDLAVVYGEGPVSLATLAGIQDISEAYLEQLLRALRNGGYFKGTVDGRYGGDTYQAVLRFQANNGLKQTGNANAETQELLFGGRYNRTPTPTVRPTATPTPKATPTRTPTPSAPPTAGRGTSP